MKTILGVLLLSVLARADGSFVPQNDSFKDLYNNYRAGIPDVVPWPGTYWPFKYDGINWNGVSASYDANFKLGNKTFKWEGANHTCSNLSGSEKSGCEGWWGHCNAWAGAALKVPEPRSEVAYKKGLLTELYMSVDSLFAGDTDKSKETGSWVSNVNSPSGRKFWDVSPKDFFLIFTNYVGVLGQGVVIDRFTGDQVWNQPISGYRILTLRPEDITVPDRVDLQLNPRAKVVVRMRMKIAWAEDGVAADHASEIKFTVDKIKDDESEEVFGSRYREYTVRKLGFRLYFDGPVVPGSTSSRGIGKIASAGRLIGGSWEHYHQFINGQISAGDLNQTHPDFIWMPTDVMDDGYGSRNPYITEARVKREVGTVGGGGGTVQPPPPPSGDVSKRIQFTIPYGDGSLFRGSWLASKEDKVKQNLRFIFSREGQQVDVTDINWVDGQKFSFVAESLNGSSAETLSKILVEAGIDVLGTQNL